MISQNTIDLAMLIEKAAEIHENSYDQVAAERALEAAKEKSKKRG